MLKIFKYTEILKHLPRSGWLRKGITHPETVASHSWQMSLTALLLSEKYNQKYDFNKIIKLCICHDLGESVIGDITPKESAYAQKSAIELKAVCQLSEETDFTELRTLFEEFEQGVTPEAKIARDLDKIDMYIQAMDYAEKYPSEDFTEFLESAEYGIKTSLGKELLEKLKA